MGILSPEYYQKLQQQTPAPAPSLTPSPEPQAPIVQRAENALLAPVNKAATFTKELGASVKSRSEEDQIKQYGGVVGSPEYLKYQSENPYKSFLGRGLLTGVGLDLPEQETWDQMTTGEKLLTTSAAAPYAVAKLAIRLPRELVKAPIRLGYSIISPWKDFFEGKSPTIASQAAKAPLQVPWIGEVPSYWQDYQSARDSGLGPLAATVATGSTALGDVTIAASLAEGIKGAFTPRSKLPTGQPIADTAPIQKALVQDSAGASKVVTKKAGASEYYSLPKTVAKKYGGSSDNTFLKITPADVAGDGAAQSAEVSIVQTRGGILQKAKDKITGTKNIYEGDFGPEVKFESQVIKSAKGDVAPAGSPLNAPAKASEDIVSIPPKPLKGFENKPITDEQMVNLSKISQINKIDPEVARTVIKSITGKEVAGNLTQAEYIQTAQALSAYSDATKFAGPDPFINPVSQYLSPQDHFTRAVENSYPQYPVYSKGYVPMEDAMRLRDVTWNGYKDQVRTIFDKYAGTGYGEERRLIKNYLEGDQSVISANDNLTPQVKSDLVGIAEKMRQLYRETRVRFGEKDLGENYQPHIADINGIHQIYKEGSELPKELKFFADFERKGSTQVQVDDALALWDIYTKAGTNKLFVNPALEKINGMYDTLPDTLKGSMKTYVQEKLGYADRLEQSINEIGSVINRKTGLNLPVDVGRKVTEVYLNLLNSGALGSVYGGRAASVMRNMLQDPILVYPRLGSEFKAQTYLDLTRPSVRSKILAEMKDKGLLETLGGPYGQELTRDTTLTGKAGSAFRTVTQGSQVLYGAADNLTRASAYRQFQLQWENALADFTGGKMSYPQFEQKMDFKAFNPLDRNIIRQKLIEGDLEGAFNHAARDVINETNFSYARGTSSRVTYGLAGKIGTKFLRWPIEYAHTLGNWARTGQFDKLIRWHGSTALTLRTIKDTFGIDFASSFGLNPLKPQAPPAVKAAIEFAGWAQARFDGAIDQVEQHKDELARQITGLGIPTGVSIGDFNDFRKTMQKYAKGDRGPNGEEFAVLKRDGSVKYWTNFRDVWKQLWGFPTVESTTNQQVGTDMRNAKFEYSQHKNDALQLLQQGKYDEAGKILEQYQINVGPSDLDKYQVPFNQRTFETLPASLKARFAPQVFPQ